MNRKLFLCLSLVFDVKASRIRLSSSDFPTLDRVDTHIVESPKSPVSSSDFPMLDRVDSHILESPSFPVSGDSPEESTTTMTAIELVSPAPAELKKAALEAHNKKRHLHGSPSLTWCDKCYEEAKKQANACQAAGKLFPGHLGWDNDEGQNLFALSIDLALHDTYEEAVESAVNSWYGEAASRNYDYSVNRLQRGTGQFTQLLWKKSTTMALAISDNHRFIVANYYPRGNVPRQIQENVGPIRLESARSSDEETTTTTVSRGPPATEAAADVVDTEITDDIPDENHMTFPYMPLKPKKMINSEAAADVVDTEITDDIPDENHMTLPYISLKPKNLMGAHSNGGSPKREPVVKPEIVDVPADLPVAQVAPLKGKKVKQQSFEYKLKGVLARSTVPTCKSLKEVFKVCDYKRTGKVFLKQIDDMLDKLDYDKKVESLQLLKDIYEKVGKDPEREAITIKDWAIFKLGRDEIKDCGIE